MNMFWLYTLTAVALPALGTLLWASRCIRRPESRWGYAGFLIGAYWLGWFLHFMLWTQTWHVGR